jgi:hypothetical protein
MAAERRSLRRARNVLGVVALLVFALSLAVLLYVTSASRDTQIVVLPTQIVPTAAP